MTDTALNLTEANETESLPSSEDDKIADIDEAGAPPPHDEDISTLKEEISRLKTMLSQQKETSDRKIREMEEFNTLFPNVSFSQLPSEVTDRVANGIPLAAAYALYEKEQNAEKERAGEINRKNAFLSAGKVGTQTRGEFFTPDEVRAMSPAQVHENYKKIRESMTHWRNKTFY